MILTATPAYGRDYKNKLQVEEDWRAGKDFQAHMPPPGWIGGPYFSISDLAQLQEIGVRWLNVRYANLSKVHVIKIGA